jgi:hypothetical protein
MADKLLFLTGKLAEKSLNKVLSEVVANPKTPPFKYRVEQIGVSVAALMTPEMIARRLKSTGEANKMILPGLCQGDLSQLHRQFGIPVERGPEDLKDLPQYFGQQGIAPDLSQYSCQIFAEIVDAPDLTVDEIVTRAEKFKVQGANVIDLGCLPNKPFAHLADAIKTLKQADFKVSVDSMNSDELLLAGNAGADYLLSLTEKTLWVADAVESTPILIPSRPGHMASLYKAIEYCLKNNKPFIADAILDPIHFGLADSIVRYHRLRKKYPNIPIMMGIGNLTELTDADTTGINAMLFGVISELEINAVLATSVSPHAVNAIAEADIARRIMHAAKRDSRLPRGYSTALNGLHDRRPFPYNTDEIAEIAAQIKDPSFRIMVSETGVHVYNREGLQVDIDPFVFYPNLGVQNDASHAFYLGVELARAQIAHQLGKRYVQDEELNWGLATEQAKDERKNPNRKSHRETSLKEKQDNKKTNNKDLGS